MLKTWAGYRPVATFLCLNPRAVDCARPFTLNAAVCNGKDVGMPALRWCEWKLANGKYCTCGIVVVSFQFATVSV